MNFRLVDSGWDHILDEALKADCSRVRIVCPFIKERAAKRLLEYGWPAVLQVITRYNLDCFREGVSDISALRLLLEAGAQIRGIKNLHAKAYLIGTNRAIITSANLTEKGLLHNHEFGFDAQEASVVGGCHEYFEKLWDKAGTSLGVASLDKWEKKVTEYRVSGGAPASPNKLGDEGVDVGFPPETTDTPDSVRSSELGFVKFFGLGDDRADHSLPVLEEVKGSGSHWAGTYPKGKRPRQVQDGSVIFMARLVQNPNDIVVYGRAIGLRHQDGRDDATAADIKRREWKKEWPHYVRVYDAEFVGGTLANGVSLDKMMNQLKSDSFSSTQRNAVQGNGNLDPHKSYMRKAAMKLTPKAIAWLNKRLERAFQKHGKLTHAELGRLDWPAKNAQIVRDAR